ncbi:zinc-ribbon and DUF3426 domain-containing protein [uncultured Thiothrix sp.]|uniref:zinc-ribbon and DUF3426 domain-containing protein n=1 Tax=uncultured Thiothrix sp. TaxID=223185 RepID=UPI0026048FE5|nr:zinc-ribbon and DUF3426 domain-containing protein [uncultured Thiothrix sp.]
MYTQCSHCRAVFRVTMKELTAAQGLLRCGECDTIFDAMKALSTTLPDERLGGMGNGRDLPGEARIHALPLNVLAENDPSNSAKPSKTNSSNRRSTKSRNFLYLSLLALCLLLLIQLFYSYRTKLLEHPSTREWTQTVCTWITCGLDTVKHLDQIKLLSHTVYTHPNTPNVLIINTSIQNNASNPQPYPRLEVSFLNQKSELVALRSFTPEEYLSKEQQGHLMPPKIPQEVSLTIEDPGKDAVRFQLRFL